jgi:hypothetical protein
MRWLIFVLALVFLVQPLMLPSNAAYAWDEPQINVYVAGSKIVPAGQSYNLQIIIANTAKYEKIKSESIEEKILYNTSLNAYNLTAWLEGDGIAKAISGKVLIPILPAQNMQTTSFLILVPQNATGKHVLTLHVEYDRVRSVYVDANKTTYFYEKEEVEVPIEIEVVQRIEPIIKLFPVRSTFYTTEINQLVINVVNEGSGVARAVEIALDSDIEILDPQKVYIPSLLSAGMQTVSFSIKAEKDGDYLIKANISYEYFTGSEWVKASTGDGFAVTFQSLSSGIFVSTGTNEFERGQKGFFDVFVMNSFSYPVSSLKLQLSHPEGIDIKIDTFPLGYLMPGEVRSVKVPVEIDDDAEFGFYNIQISGSYRLLSPYPSENELSDEISIYIKPEPDFEAECNQTLYAGLDDQIVEIRLINKGDFAEDIHAEIKPAPGILVKIPDAYLQSLKPGETGVIKFKVDVDEDVIPDTTYRMEMKVNAKDANGDEISEVVHIYITIGKSSGMRGEYYVAALLIVVAIAVTVKVMKRRKRN